MSLVSVNVPTVINADKSHGSITLPTNSITLQRRISTTVTATGITGSLSARSLDTSVATVTVSGSDIIVTGVETGMTTIVVDVAESAGYTSTYTTLIVTVTAANLLANPATNTLAKLQAVIAAGNATQYVSAGDYFDITIPTAVSMYRGGTFPPTEEMIAAGYSVYHAQNEVIAANSTWRVVCLGVNHNPSIEGNNRVHFMIGRNTDNVNICFDGYFMNSDGSSTGGWNGSEMKTWLNGTFFNALPADLRNVITACTKYSNNVGGTGARYSSHVTSSSQKIWLLACCEIHKFTSETTELEASKQAQYDYFKNGNSKVFHDHLDPTTPVSWWCRSHRADQYQGFRRVFEQGDFGVSIAHAKLGVVPCFTIS